MNYDDKYKQNMMGHMRAKHCKQINEIVFEVNKIVPLITFI